MGWVYNGGWRHAACIRRRSIRLTSLASPIDGYINSSQSDVSSSDFRVLAYPLDSRNTEASEIFVAHIFELRHRHLYGCLIWAVATAEPAGSAETEGSR